MSDTDTLNLWHEHRRVGELWRNTAGAIGFRYDPEWIGDGFAVSRTLPLVPHFFFVGWRGNKDPLEKQPRIDTKTIGQSFDMFFVQLPFSGKHTRHH